MNGLRVPLKSTLAKYGLTEDDWLKLAHGQGFSCAVCRKVPESGILHVHHNHVKGWAQKKNRAGRVVETTAEWNRRFPPSKRRLYVVGLVCQFCNRFVLARTMTLRKAKNIVTMMERPEEWWL